MSLIKVKVIDTTITTAEGVSSKGKSYKINSQQILAELNGEVRRVEINLADNASAYAPGNYTIDPVTMIQVGRYGFEFKRYSEINLVPVQSSTISTMNKVAL